MKIIVTGSQGFIGSYICAELLDKGHKVVGIDNFSKYGPVVRPHDSHPNFSLLNMDICSMSISDGDINPIFLDAEIGRAHV